MYLKPSSSTYRPGLKRSARAMATALSASAAGLALKKGPQCFRPAVSSLLLVALFSEEIARIWRENGWISDDLGSLVDGTRVLLAGTRLNGIRAFACAQHHLPQRPRIIGPKPRE